MTEQQRIVKCLEINQLVKFIVEDCSAYVQFGQLSLYDMKNMATIIDIKGNQVGFYTAKAWKDKRGEVDLPPEYDT